MLKESPHPEKRLVIPPGKKNKILLVNTRAAEGGAAKAALRLFHALERAERYELAWMSRRPNPLIVDSLYPAADPGLRSRASRAVRRLRRRSAKLAYPLTAVAAEVEFDFGALFADADVRRAIPDCDLVNLHWVSGLIDPATVAWIAANRAPVVWTLHDMAALTGGCHFDAGCGGFVDGCRRCPQLGGLAGTGPTRRYQRLKVDLFRRIPDDRLHIVSPSRWLADEARRSPQFRDRPIHVIPNAIDLDVFQPRNRGRARQGLGIPDDRPVVLFIAENVTNRRKGGHLLASVVERVRARCPQAVIAMVGAGIEPGTAGFDLLDLGVIDDEIRLSEVYSMADVTLIPSLQDNLPNVMVESMACGTPVAGFAVGGIPDLAIEGRTGALAAQGDVGGLADAVLRILGDRPFLDRTRGLCREIVEQNCSPQRQSECYCSLYDQVIGSNPAA